MYALLLAVAAVAPGFSTEEMAPVTTISDAWADCAYRNLAAVLPNDYDPIEAIAAAAIDYCIETERYHHALVMLFKAHALPQADADALYERQRRVMIRLMSAEIVRARSAATKASRTH